MKSNLLCWGYVESKDNAVNGVNSFPLLRHIFEISSRISMMANKNSIRAVWFFSPQCQLTLHMGSIQYNCRS